ncbi:MAG TPA: hypothetical protein VHY19_14955 [Steroidobacteraceae bacterium]|nr:hypothetical protein [Steroidobacteraceae bacterium]
MAARYAKASTYRDKGIVRTTFQTPQRAWSKEMAFTTAFERATHSFRFEIVLPLPTPEAVENHDRRWIVRREGDRLEVRTFLPPSASSGGTFPSAIAAATGVSKGAAHNIPALLMPEELGGRRVTCCDDNARRIEDENWATAACFRVHRTLQTDRGFTTETLWIEKASFLIRGIEHQSKTDDLCVDSVTAYEPLMDAPLPIGAPMSDS